MAQTNNELAALLNELNKAYGEMVKPFMEKLNMATKTEWFSDPVSKQHQWKEVPIDLPPTPIINVQPKGKRTTDSWYVPHIWTNELDDAMSALTGEDNKPKDEIVIAASLLHDGVERVLQELGKQMVHHVSRHCDQGWSAETISTTGWVTTNYADKARKVGYYRVAEGNNKVLSDSQWVSALINEVKPKLDDTAFTINRKDDSKKSAGGPSPLRKWSCQCTNVRTAVIMDAKCNLCGEPFAYTDKDWADQTTKDYIENELKRLHKDLGTTWENWQIRERKNRIRNEAIKAGRM